MKALFSLVGRAGFEPATNGLKGRYAHPARCAFPLCSTRMDRTDGLFSHTFCQNLPTCFAATDEPTGGLVQCHTVGYLLTCQLPGRLRQSRAREALSSCIPQTIDRGCRVLPGEGCSRKGPFAFQRWCFVGRRDGQRLDGLIGAVEVPRSSLGMRRVSPPPTTKAPSSARGAALTQVRGRMSSVPLRKAMALMTPGASQTRHRYWHEQATQNHAGWPSIRRLEVECGPFGSGSPCSVVQCKRWPKGTWDASGVLLPQKMRATLWSQICVAPPVITRT